MNETIKICIENVNPLSQNAYYNHFRSRVSISKKGIEYRKIIQDNLPLDKKIHGPVKLSLIFNFKDKRKRDLDNLNKPLIDAIKNILIEDDDQVYELFMKKNISTNESSLTIIVEKI